MLRRALVDRPRELADNMLDRMGADFGLARSLPGADRVPVTARAWVESRARIQQQFPTTVRMAWILSGIVDALARGEHDEGLARALVLAAIEQLSLDRGSWTLAEPMLLEEPAPLSSFHGRQMPTGSEQPFTRLLDARSIELLVYQVREVDDYLERRRRLGSRRTGHPTTQEEDEDDEKDKSVVEEGRGWRAKPKAKPKAKTAAGQTENATSHNVTVARAFTKLLGAFVSFRDIDDANLGECSNFEHPGDGSQFSTSHLESQMQLGALQYPRYAMASDAEHFHFLEILAGTYDSSIKNMRIADNLWNNTQFIAAFPVERVPKHPLSGISTRSGDLARFTFKGMVADRVQRMYIHLLSSQIVTVSGSGVSVLD